MFRKPNHPKKVITAKEAIIAMVIFLME